MRRCHPQQSCSDEGRVFETGPGSGVRLSITNGQLPECKDECMTMLDGDCDECANADQQRRTYAFGQP